MVMAAENTLLLNASAIRCLPNPPTKILTFKEMMEKLVIFPLASTLGLFRAPRQLQPSLLPTPHRFQVSFWPLWPLQHPSLWVITQVKICDLWFADDMHASWLMVAGAVCKPEALKRRVEEHITVAVLSGQPYISSLTKMCNCHSRYSEWRGGSSTFLLVWITIFMFW